MEQERPIIRVTIRPAEREDAAEMARLSGHLGYPCTTEEMIPRLRRILESKVDWVWVASIPEGLIGWVQCTEMDRLESGKFLEITGLVIDEAHRSNGVGAGLIHQSKTIAGHCGLKRIVVRANVVRLHAHRFYRKQGFKDIKQQQVLQLDLE